VVGPRIHERLFLRRTYRYPHSGRRVWRWRGHGEDMDMETEMGRMRCWCELVLPHVFLLRASSAVLISSLSSSTRKVFLFLHSAMPCLFIHIVSKSVEALVPVYRMPGMPGFADGRSESPPASLTTPSIPHSQPFDVVVPESQPRRLCLGCLLDMAKTNPACWRHSPPTRLSQRCRQPGSPTTDLQLAYRRRTCYCDWRIVIRYIRRLECKRQLPRIGHGHTKTCQEPSHRRSGDVRWSTIYI